MERPTLALIILAAAVSSLVTWFATTSRSPAEAAGRTAAPRPPQNPCSGRGALPRHHGCQQRHRTPAVGAATPVTPSALKAGSQSVVSRGDVLLTVSGRPTFLLGGSRPSPSYRDLGPGMSGQDDRRLGQALRRLGLNPRRR